MRARRKLPRRLWLTEMSPAGVIRRGFFVFEGDASPSALGWKAARLVFVVADPQADEYALRIREGGIVKTTALTFMFASSALLLLAGQTPPPSKPGIKVYNAIIPMIDDHLKLLEASSETPLDPKRRIMVNIQRKPKSVENIGILADPHIAKFYRSVLSDTYFYLSRIPKPRPNPYVSKFQIECGGTGSRYDARADIATVCWEDLTILGSSALPPPRYPLKVQFEFADNELMGVNLITEDPNILAGADKTRMIGLTVK